MDIEFLCSISGHPGGTIVQRNRIVSTRQMVRFGDQRRISEGIATCINDHPINASEDTRPVAGIGAKPFLPKNHVLVISDTDQAQGSSACRF